MQEEGKTVAQVAREMGLHEYVVPLDRRIQE
ncbi:hypothetical protein [Paenibacillus phoenicis]